MSSSRMAGSWTVSRSHAVDVKLAATFPVEKGAALNLSALAVDWSSSLESSGTL